MGPGQGKQYYFAHHFYSPLLAPVHNMDLNGLLTWWEPTRSTCVCVCVCVCARACAQSLSHVRLLATPWTAASQVPLSMGSPRKEYWSGLPFPPLGYLPHPGIKLAVFCLAGRFFTTELPEVLLVTN